MASPMLEPGVYRVGFPQRDHPENVVSAEAEIEVPHRTRVLAQFVYHNEIHPLETDKVEYDFTRPIIERIG